MLFKVKFSLLSPFFDEIDAKIGFLGLTPEQVTKAS